ncbi:MAG: signal recognition particle protein, partial [Ruminococcus sp.]|nr:signal recognition particle protein [Ruminococcus sp.]
TKLDGDTRGGAALSVKAVTGKPIKFAGTGEKLEDLEVFHPDRMASRILGMGDVLTLIEDAQNKLDQKEAEKMAEKIMANRFDFNDLLGQFDQIKKMGPLKGILSKIPGMGKQLDDVDINDRQIDWLQAIILSMTPAERENPNLINPSRKRRIAAGSGRTVEEVNRLIKQLEQMQKMIKQLNKGGKKGKRRKKMMLPGLGGAPFDGGMGGNMPF